MMPRVRRILTALALLLLLTACTRIPTSGPVEPGAGPTRQPEVAVEVAPERPTPGASPRMVVEGYLQAMANYQQGYSVARLYLATDVRDAWRPETGLTVYEDGYGVTSTPETAMLEAPLVGTVGPDGSFHHSTDRLAHDFGLSRDADGEWRIRNPPNGLLISRYLFDKFYKAVNLYFYDPAFTSVVPDPIFLPTGNQTPTALLQALLRGPTDWLTPVVVTAIPAQTRLNVQSAYADSAGVVEVSLNETVAALADEQRSRMAGQITWTLGQLEGITGVRFLMNGAPYAVPEADQGVVRIDSFAWMDPTPDGHRAPSVYGATAAGMVSVVEAGGPAEVQPVPGPLGHLAGIDSLAVASAGDRVALVTRDRTSLRTATIGGDPTEAMTGGALLRPQFVRSREQELWTVGEGPATNGVQFAFRIVADRTEMIALPAFEGSRVIAYRISPDGLRMAAVRRTAEGRLELGMARINRTLPELVIDGWRAIPLGDANNGGPEEIVDVGWLSPTSLLVLAGSRARQPVKPYRVDLYATEVAEIGQPDNWQARSVATSPRSGGGRATVVGVEGSWRFEEDYRWPLLARGLTAAAYAG